ncbi:MAG: hypothetical protein PV358_16355, partial [Acidimicrobiales bacterium]|nr:hypothetical protein [Acidimicrobiales bacterium]
MGTGGFMVSDASSRTREHDLIWIETPFEEPAPKLVVAAARAGASGVLDLGADAARGREALDVVTRRIEGAFGVRASRRCALTAGDLPAAVDTVVVAEGAMIAAWRSGDRRVVAEVRSVDEALDALAAGADGLVARGAESGGRVGTTGAFVLLQQIRGITDRPVWV